MRTEVYLAMCALLRPALWPAPAEGCAETGRDWTQLLAVAGEHLATPALAWALRGSKGIPPDVGDYLEAVLLLSRERTARAADELELILATLARAGLEPVLLKGAGLLADRLYPDPAMRLFVDIDLLLPERDLGAAGEALLAAGFAETPVERRWIRQERHDLPMRIHPDWPLGIELHRAVLRRPYASLADAEGVWRRRRPSAFRGHSAAVPAPTDRIAHQIAHSQLSNREAVTGIPQLRLLLDLALLRKRMEAKIDWDEVGRRFAAIGHGRALSDLLALAEALLGQPAPPGFAADGAALERLRASLERPRRTALRLAAAEMGDYFAAFAANPLLALNLIQPSRWRRRRDG